MVARGAVWEGRKALRTKTGTFQGLQARARPLLLGTPPGSVGAGGEAASQSGLIGGRAAVEEAGRWVGARRKVTVAPPTQSENSHGSTSGLPESRVLGIRAGPAGSL